MKKILLLDLEGTVIDEWFPANLLMYHIEYIKPLIASSNFDKVGIFTYAIHNTEELGQFITEIKPGLEAALNTTISDNWVMHKRLVYDLMRTHTTLKGMTMSDFDDFFMDKGATIARLAMMGAFQEMDVTIVDDCVVDSTLTVPKFNTKVSLINVKSLTA